MDEWIGMDTCENQSDLGGEGIINSNQIWLLILEDMENLYVNIEIFRKYCFHKNNHIVQAPTFD